MSRRKIKSQSYIDLAVNAGTTSRTNRYIYDVIMPMMRNNVITKADQGRAYRIRFSRGLSKSSDSSRSAVQFGAPGFVNSRR